MKLFRKLINFFVKTKNVLATTALKIDKFIKEHKKQIKLLMTVLEALFPAKTGAQKMACVVASVCKAIGYEEATDEVLTYVNQQCQRVYDEFKESLEDNASV